jgi:hypothetical protein
MIHSQGKRHNNKLSIKWKNGSIDHEYPLLPQKINRSITLYLEKNLSIIHT